MMADRVLAVLTQFQHLKPHASTGQALQSVVRELGCCPVAVDRSIEWLRLDRTAAVGRLRRTEILQLARSVSRFWAATVASGEVTPQQA